MHADPHRFAIIDYLQPFIDGKVAHQCDLVRQERAYQNAPASPTPLRHRGHTWCRVSYLCACPCHQNEDEIAFKLIELMDRYEPESIVGTWMGAYIARQMQEAARLRSEAHDRDAMIKRATEALTRKGVI